MRGIVFIDFKPLGYCPAFSPNRARTTASRRGARRALQRSMLQPSLTQSLSSTDADTGLGALGRGRILQVLIEATEEEKCAYTTWMKVRDPPTPPAIAHPPATCCDSPPTHPNHLQTAARERSDSPTGHVLGPRRRMGRLLPRLGRPRLLSGQAAARAAALSLRAAACHVRQQPRPGRLLHHVSVLAVPFGPNPSDARAVRIDLRLPHRPAGRLPAVPLCDRHGLRHHLRAGTALSMHLPCTYHAYLYLLARVPSTRRCRLGAGSSSSSSSVASPHR